EQAFVRLAVIAPYRDGKQMVEQLSSWAEQDTPDPQASKELGRAAFAVGDFDRALLFARRASDTFRQQGRVALLAQTLVLETYSALYLGKWAVAQSRRPRPTASEWRPSSRSGRRLRSSGKRTSPASR